MPAVARRRRPRPARRRVRARIGALAGAVALLTATAAPVASFAAPPPASAAPAAFAALAAMSAGPAASAAPTAVSAGGISGPVRVPAPSAPLGLLGVPPLATPASATASGYAPLGDVSRREAFTDQVSTATAVDRPGRRAALLGALGVGVTGDTALRAGGSGAVTVSLSRQVDRPVRVRAARVAIAIPATYRVGGVAAPGWRCGPVRGSVLRCAAPASVQAGAHAAIRVGLVARLPGRARLTARASWREGAGARAAGRPRVATGSEVAMVRAPLTVRVRTAHRRVLGAGAGVERPRIVLAGRLGRYDAGLPVDYRWRQLPGGPRVRWLSPRAGRASGPAVTAQVAAPAVRRPTRLRFALRARDWRGAARATTSLRVLPHRAARLAPGDRRLRVLPRAPVVRRGHVTRHRVTRGLKLTGSALAGPRPGQRVALRAQPQGGALERVRWRVVRGPRALLAGRATDRRTLVFTVPRSARTLALEARAVVAGHPVRDRAVVHVAGALGRVGRRPARHVRPRRAAAPQRLLATGAARTDLAAPAGRNATGRSDATPPAHRAARLSGANARVADDDAAEHAGAFCVLWSAAADGDADAGTAESPIALDDGTGIRLGGAVAAGDDCAGDDARVTFSRARVQVGAVVFEDVAGAVDAEGIGFSAGWLELPRGWSDDLPSRLRVAPRIAGAWGAELGEEGWGAMRVRVSIADGVELLPLPEGWTFPAGESTLAYTPAEQTFALRSVAQAPAGHAGRVTLTGTLTLAGVTTVDVAADRVVALHGVGDREVALSGAGRIQFVPGRERSEPDEDAAGGEDAAEREPARWSGAIALRTDPAAAEVALASNVTVSGATATWDEDGIALGADVRVRTGRGTFAATAAGRYVSTTEWRLAVAQSDAFPLGDGVLLEDVAGSIERRPARTEDEDADDGAEEADGRSRTDRTDRADAPRAPADEFVVSLAGAVTGWSPSSALTDVSVRGTVTNACEADARGCSTREVRLAMDVRGDAHVADQTVAWHGSASVDLATYALRFAGGAQLAGFGPQDLRLTDVQLRLTNDGPQWCRPAADPGDRAAADATPAPAPDGTAPPAPSAPETPAAPVTLAARQELAFGVSARGRVLGEAFQAAGEFARSGWCLTGAFGEFAPDGMPAGRGAAPLVDEVRIAYASTAADVVVAGRRIGLSAGEVRLTGTLNLPAGQLPEDLRGALGRRAELSLRLTRTRGAYGLAGSARFAFSQPAYVLGSAQRADQTRLGVTDAELSFAYGAATSLRLELAAHAALHTPANAARGVAASRTPLFLAAGIDLGMPSVNLSAGVDTTDPQVVGGTVRDAFGQPGLDVRRLLVSASVGADTSLGIAGDATLPDGWTRSLGMPDRTPAKVAFSVSQTNACVELEVGQLPAVLGGPGASAPVLTLGPLSATWAQIVVAPTGCTIGNPSPGKPGHRIDPGFALGFDGQVGPAPVTFAAAMRKHDVAAFAIRGTVRVGAFDAGPVSFRRTSLDLDVDTGGEQRRVDVAFAGGLDAGESTIDVEGRFRADDATIAAALRGAGRLRFADTTFAQGDVEARLEFATVKGSWTARTADVRARTQVLGAEAGLLLSYRDGAVATAAGAFQYRATVGPLGVQAGALFAYAPDGVRLDGDPRDCSIARLTPQRGAEELIVRLCSRMQLGPLSHASTFTVALPQRWDFDLVVPRSEVGVYLASVYMQGELRASLQVGLGGLKFWVRDGSARAGGCVHLFWWDTCANGIDVAFRPSTGRFEGTFLGIAVSWGSDSWRSAPAPAGPLDDREQIGAADRVLVGRSDRIQFATAAGDGRPWRQTAYEPAPGGTVPPGMVLDVERRELMVMLPLTAAARREAPRPARAYLLVFRGVEFWRDEPLTSLLVGPEGGEPRPTVAYRGVSVARVPESGETILRSVDAAGGFVLDAYGRRLDWRARGDGLVRALAADGLPLGVTVSFPTAQRRPFSRAALMRELG